MYCYHNWDFSLSFASLYLSMWQILGPAGSVYRLPWFHSCSRTSCPFPTYISSVQFKGGANGTEPTCQCRRIRDPSSILELEGPTGGGHSNPLQYSSLETFLDRGAWQAPVHRVSQSGTRLKQLSTHTSLGLKWLVNRYKGLSILGEKPKALSHLVLDVKTRLNISLPF